MRRMILLAVIGLVAVACGGSGATPETASVETTVAGTATTIEPTTTSTTVPTTTTTTLSPAEVAAIQLADDGRLIRQLWRGFSDVSGDQAAISYEYLAANNYPGAGCSPEDYATYYSWPDDYVFEVIVFAETIEEDPEWRMLSGDQVGEVPDGRVYIYQMLATTSSTSQGWPNEETRLEAHATVVDDQAYFFFSCS